MKSKSKRTAIRLPLAGTVATVKVCLSILAIAAPALAAAWELPIKSYAAVTAPALSSFGLSASTIYGGNPVTGTVLLNEAAPAGGLKVALVCTSKNIVIPPTVEVLATATSATFAISTLGVDGPVACTITASAGGVAKTSTLTLDPAVLSGVSLSPTVYAGWVPTLESAVLDGKAGPSGIVLSIASNNAAITVPTSAKVLPQASSISLGATTHPVTSDPLVTLTVKGGAVAKTGIIKVLATAFGSAKLTWSQTGANYTYNLSVTNTGRLPIESFWFAGDGLAQKNLLPIDPTAMGSAAGWYPTVGHKGTEDGYSILWRTATALQPGATATGFHFTTTATPPQILTNSATYPTLPIPTSFVYIGQPAGDPGSLVPMSHVALPYYALDVVGLLAPNTNSVANDLNDSGELVGGAEASSGGVTHAFSWTPKGGLVDLGAFGSTLGASAISVNNGGIIAGDITLNNGGEDYSIPFLIGGAFPEKPGVPPNCDSVLVDGITNTGKVIVEGQLNQLGIEESVGAFMYIAGKYTAIGETAGIGQVNELHDFHRLTNTAYGSLGSSTSTQAVYWKWVDGSTSVFDWTKVYLLLSGVNYYSSGANGEWLGTLSNGHAGYLSADESATTDLGFAGVVTGLNANGQAVGNFSPDGGYHQYGFYWSKATGFLNLNQLIDPSLGMTIVSATHINALGQIAVQTQNPKVGTDYYLGVAGLLTPK